MDRVPLRLPALLSVLALLSHGGLRADPVVPLPDKMKIGKKEGEALEGVYLNFNFAEFSAAFGMTDGVSTSTVPCEEMDAASLAAIATKIPPVAGWLDAGRAHVCMRVVGAATPEAESDAAEAIREEAEKAEAMKEKIALLQVFGIVSQLLKAEKAAHDAETKLESDLEQLGLAIKAAEEWGKKYGVNPLTGEDRSKAHMEWATGSLKASVAHGREYRLPETKRDLMIRMASCRAYIGYTEISGRKEYGKILGELMQKVLARSAIAREWEPPGRCLLGILAPKVAEHSHRGNNAKLLGQLFGKMTQQSTPDKALDLLIPHSDIVERDAIKTALIDTVTRKINQASVGEGDAQRHFWYAIKPAITDFERRQRVLKNVSLFLEESVRMSGL